MFVKVKVYNNSVPRLPYPSIIPVSLHGIETPKLSLSQSLPF